MFRATVTEPARQIDVIHQTAVLVVGSGPGGLSAAIAVLDSRSSIVSTWPRFRRSSIGRVCAIDEVRFRKRSTYLMTVSIVPFL